MTEPTDAGSPELEESRRSAGVLGKWIVENTDLLLGVYALRGLGEPAAEAVETVMKVRHLEHTRLSWELWEALSESHGIDTDALLEERIPKNLLRLAYAALRGADPDEVDSGLLHGEGVPDAGPQLHAIDGGGEDDEKGGYVRARLHRPKRSS